MALPKFVTYKIPPWPEGERLDTITASNALEVNVLVVPCFYCNICFLFFLLSAHAGGIHRNNKQIFGKCCLCTMFSVKLYFYEEKRLFFALCHVASFHYGLGKHIFVPLTLRSTQLPSWISNNCTTLLCAIYRCHMSRLLIFGWLYACFLYSRPFWNMQL